MASIGKVSAVFTASTAGLTSGVKSASSAFKSLESDIAGLRKGMSALVVINSAQMFSSIVSSVGQAVGSFARMGQAQAEVIDGMSKLAARAGLTYGELAGLKLAGDLAGVSLDSIGTALTKADVAFVKAAGGSKAATEAFASIGLSVEQLNGLTGAARFDKIADGIAGLPTEAEKAAAAVGLFGRAGAELLPLFNEGAAGIAKMRAESDLLGLSLTNDQSKNIEAMNDAFTRAQEAVAGVVGQIVANLAPAIESVSNSFTSMIGSVGGANIGQAIGDGILQGARFLAGIGDFLIQNFGSTFSYMSQVGQQWGSVWDVAGRVVTLFAGIADSLQAAFGVIIMGISGPVQSLMEAAQYIGEALGFDTTSLDTAIAGMNAFNQEVSAGITENINSAAANFGAAFGEGVAPVGQAIAGPLTTTLDSAIARAQAAAGQIDIAKPAPIDVRQTVEFANVDQAIKGIDSRSSEGIAEMFRLMRGQGADVQQQQLTVLEEIAANTSGGEDTYPFALE